MEKINKLSKILLFAAIGFFSQIRPTANSEIKFKDPRKVVVLDPGHGMDNQKLEAIDLGATYKQYYEAGIVLEQAKNIKKMLDNTKYKVILTRQDIKTSMALENRSKLADSLNADLFISLHVNNFKLKRIIGFEIYYKKNRDKRLAELLAKNLEANTPIKKRRIKKEDYKVLENTICPSILIECGYLSNKHDRKYILDTIPDIEQAIAKTIENYFKTNN